MLVGHNARNKPSAITHAPHAKKTAQMKPTTTKRSFPPSIVLPAAEITHAPCAQIIPAQMKSKPSKHVHIHHPLFCLQLRHQWPVPPPAAREPAHAAAGHLLTDVLTECAMPTWHKHSPGGSHGPHWGRLCTAGVCVSDGSGRKVRAVSPSEL